LPDALRIQERSKPVPSESAVEMSHKCLLNIWPPVVNEHIIFVRLAFQLEEQMLPGSSCSFAPHVGHTHIQVYVLP
jgi:hypothetical protein